MSDVHLVIHGHFYQPPRENPWTEAVAVEPSAAPFHDWNERITAESYRPNGWARIINDRGRVAEIVDNYEFLSFNVGPTLLSWLETHAPDVYQRMLDADRRGGGAIAQAYSHPILPLANDRDRRTQVRWGLSDFAHRFGRPATGMWLPETAVNDDVLAVLVEEGLRFTILAPSQALRVRPLDAQGDEAAWTDVSNGSIAGGQPYRWLHPAGDGRFIDLVFYDGPISHDLAFGLTGLSSQELIRRVVDAGADGTLVCVATDGETFGHHHKFADRALAYAVTHEAAANGVRVMNASTLVAEAAPTHEVEVRESAWSCVHGVGRWKADCGCATGGEPGWNQTWREPLRAALDVVRDHGNEVFERRGSEVFKDQWAARDAYIEVLLGRPSIDSFLASHASPDVDQVVALTLLEAQRHALLMYTSCGWFFNDLAGIETIQVLRYAARALDLLGDIGEKSDVISRFFARLEEARSNVAAEGSGVDIWHRHVDPSRVDAGRVTAHLALVSLFERRDLPTQVAGYEVLAHDQRSAERSGLAGVAGRVTLVHGRTRRQTTHVYAAIHLGGLEVFGATRPADDERDDASFDALADAVRAGERVTTLLRLIAEHFGPREFGLETALPDAASQIVQGTVDQLADRFRATYERLYHDHRSLFGALLSAGYSLPPELRAPAEFALARRFEAEIAAAVDDANVGSFRAAQDLAREAREGGFQLATPRAAAIMTRTLTAAVERAVAAPDDDRVGAALALLRLTRELDLDLDLSRPQEIVYEALRSSRAAPDGATPAPLIPLARRLGLAV